MSLIDRYVAEVGRHLPEKDRSDIEAEIRSMIDDTIEERGSSHDGPGHEKIVVETLEQIGDPRLLAARYAPPKRYLIGPAWYDAYLKTLQRVLFTALPVFAAVTFILTMTRNPLGFGDAIGKVIGSAFDVGVQILFWVTLVFVLLERSDEVPEAPHNGNTRAWTVTQLPKMHLRRQISIAEPVMNIAINLFLLLWIALPLIMGRFGENSGSVQFLHPNLWNFWLPIFILLIVLNLIHEVFKLRIGNWTTALMVTNVILGIISIIYIAVLVTTQDVINPAFLSTLENTPGAQRLRETAEWSVNISAAIFAGIYVWDIVNSIHLARQFKQSH